MQVYALVGRICAELGGEQKPGSLMWFFSLTLMLSESGRTETTLNGGRPRRVSPWLLIPVLLQVRIVTASRGSHICGKGFSDRLLLWML